MYNQSFTVEDAVMDKDFLVPIGKAKIMREGKYLHPLWGRSVSFL